MSDFGGEKAEACDVLQVTAGSLWGGGERHVASLLEGFVGRPVRLSLAVFSEGRLAREARALDTPVYCLPKRFRGDPGPLLGLVRLIRRLDVKIVHTHMISANIYGRLAARMAGCRLVTTLHYIDREALPFLPKPLQRLFFDGDIRMAALCDRTIATSEDMRRELIRRGLDAEKLVTILNGINPDLTVVDPEHALQVREELQIHGDTPTVGIVARLVPVKNHELFLETARIVLDRGLEVRFIVVGDGPCREDLQRMAVDLGLESHVLFTGFRTDVMTLMSVFDICVLTSNSETSAYGVSEPMSLGRPVVATAVGGVPELIDHGSDGWLCPPGDASALAEAICELLSDRDRAASLGARAALKVRDRLSLEAMAREVESVYRETLDLA